VRRLATALAAALVLAGCPIPQPLPEYSAGTITPPRIVMNEATSQIATQGTVILVAPDTCTSTATAPSYDLAATLVDQNTVEPVVARWFVNYDKYVPARYGPLPESGEIAATSSTDTHRAVPPLTFHPWGGWGTVGGTGTLGGTVLASGRNEGAVQIVELVVSNGFDPAGAAAPLPYRSPAGAFEAQMFRWVFVTSAAACP